MVNYCSTWQKSDLRRTQPGVDLDQNHIIPIEPSEKRDTYLRSLRIYNGRFSDEAFWRLLLRPFVVFWYPAVLWAFLIYGTTLSWIVVFSVVNAAIFTLPPYNFTVDQVGLISISPFVLSLIGEALAGPLNDYICLVLTKRNHGIYEPEFRLALMVLVLLLGITGFFGFGAAVHYQTHWIGPVLTFGIANMAMAFAAPCVYGYVIDSHETLREEGTVVPIPNCTMLALTEPNSACGHQCSKFSDFWPDVLCKRLA